jgi:hypothetical protein
MGPVTIAIDALGRLASITVVSFADLVREPVPPRVNPWAATLAKV